MDQHDVQLRKTPLPVKWTGPDFDAAKTELKRCAGSHFDPSVVEAFLRVPEALLEEIRRRSTEP